jgi:trigger factor
MTIEDEQIQSVLDRLRESHATWEPVERAVQNGDRVAIDVHGRVEDTTLVDSKDAEYVVDAEGPQPAPGFADQLVGMKIGEERSFTLTLPEDYRRRELASKAAEFTVTLHGVKERRLPEVDDEFAKTVGDEYETADQLREGIHKQLLESEEQSRAREHEESVIRAVVDQATVELPPQLAEEESQRLLEQLSNSLDRQGITIEQYLRFTGRQEPQLREELRAQGERSVRRSEVLNAVARAEGFEAGDDEVRQELVGAETDPAEIGRLERLLESATVRERVAALLRERKAARFLLETVGGVKLDEGAVAEEVEAEPVAAESGETKP